MHDWGAGVGALVGFVVAVVGGAGPFAGRFEVWHGGDSVLG